MNASLKRTVKRARANENSPLRSLFIAALVFLAVAPAARAATLDTPALLDLTGASNFICNFTNLDPNKTAILNASGTSGLIRDDGQIESTFPTSLSVPPGQTATTIRDGCSRSGGLEQAAACRCHFEFTGVSKGKVRAALSTDVAGSVAAD